MKVLLVTADPGEILTMAEKYFTTNQVRAVKVSIRKYAAEYIPAVDSSIDFFTMREAIKEAEGIGPSVIVLAQDSLWFDVANARLFLNEGGKLESTFMAHNLIVIEELLRRDIDYWDLILYRPITDDPLDFILGEMYQEFRNARLPELGPFVKLPEDETEALDQTVEEINSFLGLDDDGE